jgi:hypothetical protein
MVKNVSYTLVYTICISMPICMRVCMYLCGARACVCACMCVYTRAYIPHIHMRYTPTQKKKPGRIQSQDDGSPTRTRYDVRTSVPPRSETPPTQPANTHTYTHAESSETSNHSDQSIPAESASPTTLTATPKNWKFSSTKPPSRFRRNFLIRKIFGFSGSRRARSALLLGAQDTSVLLMCC